MNQVLLLSWAVCVLRKKQKAIQFSLWQRANKKTTWKRLGSVCVCRCVCGSTEGLNSEYDCILYPTPTSSWPPHLYLITCSTSRFTYQPHSIHFNIYFIPPPKSLQTFFSLITVQTWGGCSSQLSQGQYGSSIHPCLTVTVASCPCTCLSVNQLNYSVTFTCLPVFTAFWQPTVPTPPASGNIDQLISGWSCTHRVFPGGCLSSTSKPHPD